MSSSFLISYVALIATSLLTSYHTAVIPFNPGRHSATVLSWTNPETSRADSDRYGWGFSLKDSTAQPARWCMIAYRTEAEAKTAREKIAAATADAIEIIIA